MHPGTTIPITIIDILLLTQIELDENIFHYLHSCILRFIICAGSTNKRDTKYNRKKFDDDTAHISGWRKGVDLYSNYLKPSRFTITGPDQVLVTKESSSPEKVDVFWTNLIILKVNNFLNVSYGLDHIYDDDIRQFGDNGISAATQFRSQLNIGFTARF